MRSITLTLLFSLFFSSFTFAQQIDLDNLSNRNIRWLTRQGVSQAIISTLSVEDRALLTEALQKKMRFRRQTAVGVLMLLSAPFISAVGLAIAFNTDFALVLLMGVGLIPTGLVIGLTSFRHSSTAKSKIKQLKENMTP